MRSRDYRPTSPQLHAFVATADIGHLGQAAARLGISQPSLSQALSTLEQGLGVQLVECSTRQVLVTLLGRDPIPYTRRTSEIVDEITARVSGRIDDLSGPLSIGVILTVAPYVLPGSPQLAHDELSDLKLRAVEEPARRLIKPFRSGTIGTAIMALSSDAPSFEGIYLYDEEFYIVVPEDYPLAGKEDVKLEATRDSDSPLFDDGYYLCDQVLDICHKVDAAHGRASGLKTQAASLSTVMQCAADGLGQLPVPESVVKIETDRPGLAVVRLEGLTRLGCTIGLIHRVSLVCGGESSRIAELV